MTVQIHGKSYVTVAERLQLVLKSGKSFEVVESKPIECGEHWVWQVEVMVDGNHFVGSAEVHLNAKPGSADATDAWACGETSAMGRALAWAGYGVIDGIASADEMRPATDEQLKRLHAYGEKLGYEVPGEGLTFEDADQLLREWFAEYNTKKAS